MGSDFNRKDIFNMSSLYPDLTTENMESQNFTYNPQQAQRSDPQPTAQENSENTNDINDENEDVEIVIQIPEDQVEISSAHSNGQLHRLTGPITVINPDPDVPYLEFGDVKLYLTEELFVLHPELETFVFGGREGPVLGTDFHIVFNLKNAPDDAIIALTCVFMNNCSYKNLFVEEQQPTNEEIGDRINSGLNYVADAMSKGISWTGDKTKDFIQTSAENYNLKNPANQTPAQISTGVQKTVQYVSTGTGAVASAIGTAASWAGKAIAQKVDEKYGSKGNSTEESRYRWRQVGKVGAGVLTGYGKVWSALETTGKSVAVVGRDCSASVMEHKHGASAGKVTYDALNIGVNMTKTFFHVEDMGLKKICKNIAKSSGQEYLQKHIDRRAKDKSVNQQFFQNQPQKAQNLQITS